MEDNNINNETKYIEKKYSFKLLILIVLMFIVLAGSTYAYLFGNRENAGTVRGKAGNVDLTLTVTKVLPTNNTIDNILVVNFEKMASSINADCVDDEFALCQVYKVNLVNASNVLNTKLKGSISFSNETAPNLSWVYLGTNFSTSTNYTSTMLGDTFNTASSEFTPFIDNYLLNAGTSIDFYILVWVNEVETEQLDEGSYTGSVRFEDANGEGVTGTFANNV